MFVVNEKLVKEVILSAMKKMKKANRAMCNEIGVGLTGLLC